MRITDEQLDELVNGPKPDTRESLFPGSDLSCAREAFHTGTTLIDYKFDLDPGRTTHNTGNEWAFYSPTSVVEFRDRGQGLTGSIFAAQGGDTVVEGPHSKWDGHSWDAAGILTIVQPVAA